MDDDGNRSIDFKEFEKGLREYGLTEFDKTAIKEVFDQFDRDGSGTIDFDEFLVKLRVSVKHKVNPAWNFVCLHGSRSHVPLSKAADIVGLIIVCLFVTMLLLVYYLSVCYVLDYLSVC